MISDTFVRKGLRLLLAAFYAYAGYAHIANPDFFLRITPDWVPFPEAVIYWTGIAEIAGALGLTQPFFLHLRKAAGIGLALYALCVWPANIHHMMMDLASSDQNLSYHIPRMIAQPILIWLALWVSGATEWTVRRLWERS